MRHTLAELNAMPTLHDANGQVHVDHFPDRGDRGGLTADDIAARVAQAYAADRENR